MQTLGCHGLMEPLTPHAFFFFFFFWLGMEDWEPASHIWIIIKYATYKTD